MSELKIKERLFNICKEKNITLTELAKKTGISRGTMYGWNRSVPRREHLLKVCKELNIPLSYLLDEEEQVINKKQMIKKIKELLKEIEQM